MQQTQDRRGFFRWVIAGGSAIIGALTLIPGLGLLLSPMFAGASRKKVKVLFQNPGDASSATFVPAKYEGQEPTAPGLYYRKDADGKPVILSARCTHAGCAVQWKAGDKKFFCPCHQGYFDELGKNVSGPPPRPLDRLPVEVVNGEMIVEAPQA